MAETPSIQLWLSPGAEESWRQVVLPWLVAGRGRLERGYVIVPTRGQAQALKQRCLSEGVALLGVEFLSPGLARKKWMALAGDTGECGDGDEGGALARAARPAIGRELLLLGLRTLVARRLAPLAVAEEGWGFWKSLQSDPERALDDFDELLKGGFRAVDFPLAPLADVFGELTRWVEERGYAFAPVQAESAGLARVGRDAARIGGRLLVCGPGAELWGEFFNMAAFVRRCGDVTVVLPAPEFRGRAVLDEKWVELWRVLLGVEAQALEVAEAAGGDGGGGGADKPDVYAVEGGGVGCAAVAALWTHGPGSAGRATVRIGRTRADEMELVVGAVEERLAAGAENIAVIFPAADAAHHRLTRRLAARGIVFVDLLGTAGAPPVDVQAQRALLAYHVKGGRLEELLALWPLLRAIGAATLSLGEARRACERAFDETQSHAVEKNLPYWRGSAKVESLVDIVGKLGAAWPDELTLADALQRLRAVCAALALEPAATGALEVFAGRSPEAYPRAVVLATLASFLPENSPVRDAPGRSGFARVTLTTRRRAEGAAWSHLVFVECNAGAWPERRESSCWLTDAHREALNERGRFGMGLFTTEDRAALERAGCAALARDTAHEVVFTAALFDDEEPELKLAPNAWLERVLWARGEGGPEGDLEKAFERLATGPQAAGSGEENGGGPTGPTGTAGSGPSEGHGENARALDAWHAVWAGRRDAARPFDEFFFAGDPARITPASLTARRIEAGVRDPAELWFDSVLDSRRVEWTPFTRARRRVLGQRAHEALAMALRPATATAGRALGEMPLQPEAAARLAAALAALRARWPADIYWDSFHAELTQVCGALLENVYALPESGRFVATEAWLPAGATIPLGGGRLPVVGRMDLVRLDRPDWRGARVDVIDFKTGGDLSLSAARMARDGSSLQLGVYLAAALSLGAAGGRVWMVKPGEGEAAALGAEELDAALAPLARLERFFATGVYGALTRDRSEYAPPGYAWPLACAPVPEATLRAKFAATFGGSADGGAGEGARDE